MFKSLKLRSMWKLMGIMVLSGAFVGCNTTDLDDGEITAFSLAVQVEDATVGEVTDALATYIHEVDDTENGLVADWIVAGGDELEDGADASEAALDLPGGHKILEVCNHHYAAQAMGFGPHHGVALPCEISITQNEEDVDVTILNPEAIFQVFFGDVPEEYAADMEGMAAAVRDEIEDLVVNGLADFEGVSTSFEDVGTEWAPEDIQEFYALEYSISRDIAIPKEYQTDDESRQEYKAIVIERILETLTHEDMEQAGSTVEGLSVDDWRSARTHALNLPTNVSVVEVCSPTYAGAALETGLHHAPALPCQMGIYVDGDSIQIDVLDPMFIFPVFFSDAPEEAQEQMAPMAQAVQSDILLMVDAAINTL